MDIFSGLNMDPRSNTLRKVLFTAFISLTIMCNAQDTQYPEITGLIPAIKISYISTVIFPGASAGAEFILKASPLINRHNPRKLKVTREQLLTADIDYYHHPGFHDNLYFTAGWEYRRIRTNGYFTELSAGLGYSRTFLGGTTYRVADDGSVSIWHNAGYSYALLTTGGGAGFDLSARGDIPVKLFLDMNVIFMYPYNSTIYFRPLLKGGAILSILQLHKKKPVKQLVRT